MRPLFLSCVANIFILVVPAAAHGTTTQQQQVSADSAAPPTAPRGRAPRSLDTVKVTGRPAETGYGATLSTSATRTDLPLRDTPRTVSIVTRQLIADQAMQSMADVVRYVPGVSMAAGEGHRDAPTIRGNSTTADFFVDGVRDDAQYLRDLYNAERIEVLKGPEALLFGRGGGGGVINRVMRQAGWAPVGSITMEGGSFGHKRAVADLGQSLRAGVAGRLTAMYERSGGFRDAASVTRHGVNPTLAFLANPNTIVRIAYESFLDQRRVDRGIPSYRGAPAPVDITTFVGDPAANRAESRVNLASATLEHRGESGRILRNRTTWADYDKFYQNTVPGAVDATGTRVALTAYNHGIVRRNVLNATDATWSFVTAAMRHTMVAGVDVSRQRTVQVRRTGYLDDGTSSYSAPLSHPTVAIPLSFRQSASDADNVTLAEDAAVFVQDQIAFARAWLLIGGVRYERFDIAYHDNRSGQDLHRRDRFASPRAGVVFKAAAPLSLYASYGVSHLPGSGDQFTALTVTTATLEPERFTNREVGVKWDVRPEFALTGAFYRLDRTNMTAPDPNTAGRVVQTGAQRTTGWEIAASGRLIPNWSFITGLASQDASIRNTTSGARAGAKVALVPHATLSVWSRYELTPALGVGFGIVHQTEMYAAVDNTVKLPGFTRADAAAFAALRKGVRLQLNLENLLDTRYFPTSHGNNNIMPGAPRTLRLTAVVSR